jgi:hypothetical protein
MPFFCLQHHYEFQTRLPQTDFRGSTCRRRSALPVDLGSPAGTIGPGSRRRRNDSSLLPLRRSGNPVEYFNSWLTPVPHFFVRNHMHEPSELDAHDWRLTVGGEVEKPLTLSLAEFPSSRRTRSSTRSSAPAMDAACSARKFPAFSGARARWARRVFPVRACAMFCSAPE